LILDRKKIAWSNLGLFPRQTPIVFYPGRLKIFGFEVSQKNYPFTIQKKHKAICCESQYEKVFQDLDITGTFKDTNHNDLVGECCNKTFLLDSLQKRPTHLMFLSDFWPAIQITRREILPNFRLNLKKRSFPDLIDDFTWRFLASLKFFANFFLTFSNGQQLLSPFISFLQIYPLKFFQSILNSTSVGHVQQTIERGIFSTLSVISS